MTIAKMYTPFPSNSIIATSGTDDNITNSTIPTSSSVSIDNLYPAIFQCFAIIIGGYIAGRAGLITQSQGKGIGTFVGKFCLPALLFKSMVELDFSQVNWYFLLGIAISKTGVFVVVVVLTLLIRRPMHLGYAGLFGIFATQSNDFALGYPILKALYSETNPEYLQYIYLIAPISLVLLNPIGFTMLEIHRRNEDTSHRSGTFRLVLHVTKDVLSNPIVFMVLIGIVGNFVFKQKVPTILGDILDVLGNAFSASALFYLGLSVVGKVQGQLGVAFIVPMLLITAKTLLLPLVTWQVVGALELNLVNNSRSLSMFGFLYGTFPTAPSVFLYASHFSVAQDIVATGMVACTFMSAPLMFVSAKMMRIVVNNEMDFKTLLVGTSFDLSIISLVCNVWIVAVLLLSRRHKKMPHHFLLCLVISQTIACIGMIVYDGVETKVVWQHYTQFVILLIGVLSARCFTAVLSIVLYLLHCRSLCYVLRVKAWLYFFGIGFPMFSAGVLLLLGRHHMHDEIDPSFHYGSDQAVLSVVVLGACTLINITFLVLRQRNSRQQKDKQDIKVRRKTPATKHRYEKINTAVSDDESMTESLLPEERDVRSPHRKRYVGRTKLLENTDGASHRTKLLHNTDHAGDNNRYNSLSCSACTENCEVNLYKHRALQNSASIEDIVPFPEDVKTNRRVKRNRPNGTMIDNTNTEMEIPGTTDTTDIERAIPGTTDTTNSERAFPATIDTTNTENGVCGTIYNADTETCVSRSTSSITSDDSYVDSIRDYECQNGTCSYQQRQKCAGLLRCYNASSRHLQVKDTGDVEVKVRRCEETDEYQTGKFLVLLLLLQISMFMGLFLCFWRLFNHAESGIYVEIEFLDGFFNYGQSLVVFAVFGFDTRLMLLPCMRRWRKWVYGVESMLVPSKKDLTEEERHLCDQFIKYHRENCQQDIVRDMKYRFRTYNEVFCGTSFCDWLVEVGLSIDRGEAVLYGQTLLKGQVIGHITSEHDFHDMPYFYRFIDDTDLEEE